MIKAIFLAMVLLPLCGFCLSPEQGEEPVLYTDKIELSTRAQRMADRFESEVRAEGVRKKTNIALDGMIRLAAYKLRRDGQKDVAKKMMDEWNSGYRYMLEDYRCEGITCHEPLNKWLAEKVMVLYFILGADIMRMTRLEDLITLNYCLKVLFSCPEGMTEHDFYMHMVEDNVHNFKGLLPVLGFWISEISCVGLTWGTGFLFCSPISAAVEYLTKLQIAPRLSPVLYNWSCK